ncbi:hypothetical protein LIER_27589 [Lithospermum erythrorhizon]|uniref:Uncharacterized protein n=1 Tax=Lithospermum erythrorhizon TaxID=34254 RepID=A0AAV3RG66_LITER
MPHKVSFKAVTSGKDPLKKVSKRKSKSVLGESPEIPSSAPAPKRPRKATKKLILEGAPKRPRKASKKESWSGVIPLLLRFLPRVLLLVPAVSMACARGLFLRWSECEESRATLEADKISLEKLLSEVNRQRDEAWAQADHFKAQAFDFKNKHANIRSVCAGLVKSESDLSAKHESELAVFKSSLEEAAVHIKEL